MDKLKQWVALTVLAAVAILAAGWFLLVSPKRGEAEELRATAASQVAANSQLQTQLEVLRAKAKDLPKKQAELAKVSAKIPTNPSLPALVRALTAASTSAGVEFVSVTPGAPAAAAAAAPAAPAAPGGPAAAPAAPAAPAAAPAGVAGQLAQIPLTLNVVGDYFEIEQFLANLEELPRALRITNLTLAPGASPTAPQGTGGAAENGTSLTSTITGSVFMAAGAAPAAAPVAPAAAPAN